MAATSKIHWDEVELEKEVPIPVHTPKASPSVAKLEQMELNDSFTLPNKLRGNLTNAIVRFRKSHKSRHFVTRAVDGDMVRCWRVK